MIRTLRSVIVVVGVLSAAAPAFAQITLPDRPYRGLFGGGHGQASRHTVDLSVQVAEAYDDNVYADAGAPVTPTARQESGYYTNVITGGSYNWKGDRVQFAATGASTLRQYSGMSGVQVMGTTGGVGVTAAFSPRTRLFLNQSAAYSPSYLYGLFPGVAPPAPGDQIPVAPDFEADVSESYTYGTSAEFTQSLSRRNSVSASAEYTYTDVARESLNRRDAFAYVLRGQFAQAVSKRTTWRLGYRYRKGDVGYGVTLAAQPTVERGVDFGLDHTKVLSATRQAVWGVSLGTSAVDVPEGVSGEVSGLVYRVSGGATFGYQFGRSWQARASYQRGIDYIPGLATPVFADGITAVLDGLWTERWGFSLSAGYSTGESALFSRATAFDTYLGSLKIRYALSRMWAANVEYVYYYYDFSGTAQLPAGVSSNLERNGLRAGLTLLMPALRK